MPQPASSVPEVCRCATRYATHNVYIRWYDYVGPCLPKALGRLQATVFIRHAGGARGLQCITSHNGPGLIPAHPAVRSGPLHYRNQLY